MNDAALNYLPHRCGERDGILKNFYHSVCSGCHISPLPMRELLKGRSTNHE